MLHPLSASFDRRSSDAAEQQRLIRQILNWLRENVLREEVIAEALRELRRRLAERPKTTNSEVPELEAQVRTVKAEVERLGAALLATDENPVIVRKMIAEREKRLTDLEARLATIRTAPSVLDLEVRRIEKEARAPRA